MADSACTTTAYLSGVKTNYEVIGLNAQAEAHSCDSQLDEEKMTESIVRWAQKSCKATGIVTTTRITHASPAGKICLDDFIRRLSHLCLTRQVHTLTSLTVTGRMTSS